MYSKFLLGSKGVGTSRSRWGKGRGRRGEGVMTQSLYAHMNKGNFKNTYIKLKKKMFLLLTMR
jgi:hypothetical protein